MPFERDTSLDRFFDPKSVFDYFGGNPPIVVDVDLVNPGGLQGLCISLGEVMNRSILRWDGNPIPAPWNGFPNWMFEARQLIHMAKSFEFLRQHYETLAKNRVTICGHHFPSAHFGVIDLVGHCLDVVQTNALFLWEQETAGRESGPYYSSVWAETSKVLRRSVATEFDEEEFGRMLDRERAKIQSRKPFLFSKAAASKTLATETAQIRKQDFALGFIASESKQQKEITQASVANAVGVSRETISRSAAWKDVRAALKVANGPDRREMKGFKKDGIADAIVHDDPFNEDV